MSLMHSAAQSTRKLGRKVSHQAPAPSTLLHNLRTQPLTFALACLGLLAVLGAKALAVRARSYKEDKLSGR